MVSIQNDSSLKNEGDRSNPTLNGLSSSNSAALIVDLNIATRYYLEDLIYWRSYRRSATMRKLDIKTVINSKEKNMAFENSKQPQEVPTEYATF
jgi:hypothetical protein